MLPAWRSFYELLINTAALPCIKAPSAIRKDRQSAATTVYSALVTGRMTNINACGRIRLLTTGPQASNKEPLAKAWTTDTSCPNHWNDFSTFHST
jgi:hypothetical protein